jgi:putative flavoprotein involved in K+ transport
MRSIHTVVIGGGQAGLAMSRCLTDRAIDHVVLERGRVAERWRSERWDSLRLLTPRWQSRLPGWSYRGLDPQGFMAAGELVDYLAAYARSFAAPVETDCAVRAVRRDGERYRVETSRGTWRAEAVVIATGDNDTPHVPALAAGLSPAIHATAPTRYRNPGSLPPGGVLVVGASASGVQLAAELARAGRPVTIAVGRHTRLPRRHRGRDILWWLDVMGVLDQRADEVRDLEAARAQPSMQLIGDPDHRTLDLAALGRLGVRLVGRVAAVDGDQVALADDLPATLAAADDKLVRLLGRIDAFAARARLDLPAAAPLEAVAPAAAPPRLDLAAEGITSVVWATGFVRRYPWLRVPVLDGRGEIRHHLGVTDSPGLYALGLRFLRRRNSSFLDGVGRDAAALADHIVSRRAGASRAVGASRAA